jgi:hypothetical protein
MLIHACPLQIDMPVESSTSWPPDRQPEPGGKEEEEKKSKDADEEL